MYIFFRSITILKGFTHGQPVRSRPEGIRVLRLGLELLARLQVMVHANSKLWQVLPVVPRSAGRTGWLTSGIRYTSSEDMSKWVITFVQFHIVVENMFTT